MPNKGDKEIKVDWERLDRYMTKANMPETMLCRKIGRSHGYIYARRKRGTLPESVLELMCNLFDWEYDLLMVQPAPENETENTIAEIMKRLEALEEKLAETKEEEMLTKPEKAVLLLKQMTFENGSCEQDDFISKAASLNLNGKHCEYAIKFTNSKVITKGYGQNKTRWIVRY